MSELIPTLDSLGRLVLKIKELTTTLNSKPHLCLVAFETKDQTSLQHVEEYLKDKTKLLEYVDDDKVDNFIALVYVLSRFAVVDVDWTIKPVFDMGIIDITKVVDDSEGILKEVGEYLEKTYILTDADRWVDLLTPYTYYPTLTNSEKQSVDSYIELANKAEVIRSKYTNIHPFYLKKLGELASRGKVLSQYKDTPLADALLNIETIVGGYYPKDGVFAELLNSDQDLDVAVEHFIEVLESPYLPKYDLANGIKSSDVDYLKEHNVLQSTQLRLVTCEEAKPIIKTFVEYDDSDESINPTDEEMPYVEKCSLYHLIDVLENYRKESRLAGITVERGAKHSFGIVVNNDNNLSAVFQDVYDGFSIFIIDKLPSSEDTSEPIFIDSKPLGWISHHGDSLYDYPTLLIAHKGLIRALVNPVIDAVAETELTRHAQQLQSQLYANAVSAEDNTVVERLTCVGYACDIGTAVCLKVLDRGLVTRHYYEIVCKK